MTGISRTSFRSSSRKGFTLVEILIVVIILGILAAIVIPQFTNASTDARKSNLASQVQTIKSQISLYMLQHNDQAPTAAQGLFTQLTEITDANGTNPPVLATTFGPYLQATPTNPLQNTSAIVYVTTAGPLTVSTQTTQGTTVGLNEGWVYVASTGEFHGVNGTGNTSDDGN